MDISGMYIKLTNQYYKIYAIFEIIIWAEKYKFSEGNDYSYRYFY